MKEEDITPILIAIKAVGITDYAFCKTALDSRGRTLPGYYALYFGKSVTEKETELYWRARVLVDGKLRCSESNKQEDKTL